MNPPGLIVLSKQNKVLSDFDHDNSNLKEFSSRFLNVSSQDILKKLLSEKGHQLDHKHSQMRGAQRQAYTTIFKFTY